MFTEVKITHATARAEYFENAQTETPPATSELHTYFTF